ncbi:unnamed protein product [Cuscuta epithymum]|uniref:Plastid lipid-associated protein/fibrillin conserved domain-containing protein n=1 Tax=Cuscuta epithymum TaxID=186058 RepID=A0AAV0CXL6_9ASTE|nr:unnamed protein product [Cuscuta epithymum]
MVMVLQLADQLLKKPLDIINDVLVKVGRFIFPADFVGLDMKEGPTSIILGRPFLAAGGAQIDVKGGKIIFRLDKETHEFSMRECIDGDEGGQTKNEDAYEDVLEITPVDNKEKRHNDQILPKKSTSSTALKEVRSSGL